MDAASLVKRTAFAVVKLLLLGYDFLPRWPYSKTDVDNLASTKYANR